MNLLEILKFEIFYRLKRKDTYVFFSVLFFFSIIAFNFIFENQNIGTSSENSPFIIAKLLTITSGIFMVITSLVMGVPILRDFEHHIESIFYVQPISKLEYLFGRFLGSFIVLLFIFSALIWGLIIGDLMPWRDFNNQLPFRFWHYLHPFITLIIPTLFYSAALFFVSGTLSRNLIVVYTQGVLFFIFFILSNNIDNAFLSSLVEPFSFKAISQVTASWSGPERNTKMLPIIDAVLYNRLLWISIGIASLILGYEKFDFKILRESGKQRDNEDVRLEDPDISRLLSAPSIDPQHGFKKNIVQLTRHSLFYFNSIFKELSFWSILICGAVIILINSVNLGTAYGVDSLPKTYLIVEELQESSIFFFLIVLIFYTGELIWQERKIGAYQIFDTLPVSDFVVLTSKFLGLLLIYVVLLLALILSGVLFQTSLGYFNYEFDVYFMGFFVEIFSFLVLYTIVSFFVQIMFNSKFIGYIIVFVFFIVTLAVDQFELCHELLRFGGVTMGKYSDMNGYGHHLLPFFSFQLYWLFFCMFLFVLSVPFLIRGEETRFSLRFVVMKRRFNWALIKTAGISLSAFMAVGIYIYANTNVINEYMSTSEKNIFRADYEKTLKRFSTNPQPTLKTVKLNVELYPSSRDYYVDGSYMFINHTSSAFETLFVQKWVDQHVKLENVAFEGGATIDSTYKEYEHYGYILNNALAPGDSIHMKFQQNYVTNGFMAQNSSKRVVQNGMFLDNQILPMLGYNDKFELRDNEDRLGQGLEQRLGMAKRENSEVLKMGAYGVNSYEIDLEIVIGTEDDQIAVAPGKLLREWKSEDRNYVHYKMMSPMMNLYSINSGRYDIYKDYWVSPNQLDQDSVDISILHHPGHEYNLDRMMSGVKKSLEYYSEEFSPYQYDQLSIIEFPRYIEFAQSFPNMIPFSEALGFILDIDDEKDVDIAFFVTAHEVAHQWWGHQVTVADVQGWPMILESLSQYSALMVLKKHYPKDKIDQFVSAELKRYLKQRLNDPNHEVPLDVSEKQEYIYYRKGLVNLYALQSYISEESVNRALRAFISDWNVVDGRLKKDRYPTSYDLIDYFRKETPDSLQFVIRDLFETITIYDNSIKNVSLNEVDSSEFVVEIELDGNKYRVDSLGVEASIELKDWIDIGIYSKDEHGVEVLSSIKKHRIKSSQQFIHMVQKTRPTKVVIDPHYKLIDKVLDDNIYKL